jgi:hypothetical protein
MGYTKTNGLSFFRDHYSNNRHDTLKERACRSFATFTRRIDTIHCNKVLVVRSGLYTIECCHVNAKLRNYYVTICFTFSKCDSLVHQAPRTNSDAVLYAGPITVFTKMHLLI